MSEFSDHLIDEVIEDIEPTPHSRRWRWVGLVVGLVLLSAAIAMVVQQRSEVADAWRAVRSPDPVALAVLCGAVFVNVFLTGAMYRALLSKWAKVSYTEMTCLMGAATLVNYVPMQPGLFGRIAYHKTVHGVPARACARTVLEASGTSGVLALLLAAGLVLSSLVDGSIALSLIPPAALVIGALAYSPTRRLGRAGVIRFIELFVWAARYWAAFELIDQSIPPATAMAFSCVTAIVNMVPFISNGLGLREWANGLAAGFLQAAALAAALSAELVNRAAEIAVVVPTGLIGGAALGLWRGARNGATSQDPGEASEKAPETVRNDDSAAAD